MASPAEKLAEALEKLQTVQVDGIVQSERLSRTYLTRLVRAGFLHGIIRGWHFVAIPEESSGSTVWYSRYWSFLRQYLAQRFGEDYCLLPEASLNLLTGSTVVPRQLAIMRRSPGQQALSLYLDTSLFIYQEKSKFPERIVEIEGVRAMDLSEALVRLPESFYRTNSEGALIALRLLRDPTLLLADLLGNGRSVVAGRIAGAFRHIGDDSAANRIRNAMLSSGYEFRESDPFQSPVSVFSGTLRPLSPHVARLQSLWASMREDVAAIFPPSPENVLQPDAYLVHVDEIYVQDAYHSLSIEGYLVTPELIEKVRSGFQERDDDPAGRQTRAALAARGYYEAFQSVKTSVSKTLQGEETITLLQRAHHEWHQSLFAPSVRAGLLKPSSLAGYRQSPVFISGSRHVPLPHHALPDVMHALFELIAQESIPAVRAVLGHFLFVFIHPYSDGNGRIGRFLMNFLFASDGYPWTIIHLENRRRYMEALEEASVNRNIKPFAHFVLAEMNAGIPILPEIYDEIL